MFKYTTKGYIEAKNYLISINKLYLIEMELSTDGYTLVALANSLLKKEIKDVS